MIGSLFFIFNRLVEITFLIPIVGMLAYFVDGYLKANQITPPYILVLFIVSVIAVFWCADTLIRLSTTRRSPSFVAFVDLLFCGAFIASVYQLRFIANADCGNWHGESVYVSLGPFGAYGHKTDNPLSHHLNKSCAMLKTCFALGIMEALFFFWTAIIAAMMHRKGNDEVENRSRRRSHSSRRGHSNSRRHRSSSRRHYVV